RGSGTNWRRKVSANGRFVQLQTEAGLVAQPKLAGLDRVPAGDQAAPPGHVEVGERFLNHEVRRAEIEVERGGEGDGADRAVRRDAQILTRGQGGDLLAHENAATVSQIRLDYIRGAEVDQSREVGQCVEPLARRNGRAHRALY